MTSQCWQMTPSPKWGLLVPCYQWVTQEEGFMTLCLCLLITLFEEYSHTFHSTPHWNSDTGGLGSCLGICIFTTLDRCFWCAVGKGNHEIRHLIYAAIPRERKQDRRFFFNKIQDYKIPEKDHPARWHIVFYPTATFRWPFQVAGHTLLHKVSMLLLDCPNCWKVLPLLSQVYLLLLTGPGYAFWCPVTHP